MSLHWRLQPNILEMFFSCSSETGYCSNDAEAPIKFAISELQNKFVEYGFGLSYTPNSLVVDSVTFDLKNNIEVLNYFVELALFRYTAESLKTSVSQQKIDQLFAFITYSLTTFRDLRLKYGETSSEVRAALVVLDKNIEEIVKLLSNVFNQKIECELVFGGKSLGPLYDETLVQYTLNVTSNSNTSYPTTGPSVDDIAVFHILLWTGIAYAMAIIMGMFATAYMTINLPSILERPVDIRPKTD